MKDKIDQYFSLRNEIFDEFQFIEEWHQYPLSDYRDYFWTEDGSSVRFDEKPLLIDKEPDYYCQILKKKVYRKDGFALIIVDTNGDGNVYASIFDEDKEFKNKDINWSEW